MSDVKQMDPVTAASLNGLYRRYSAWLGNRLRVRVGSDEAADVVQETYLRITPYLLDDIRHPKALLLRVAMNLVRDEKRRLATKDRADSGGALSPGALPADAVDRLQLKQILQTMPPLYRDIFVLSRFDGMGCRHANCAPETLPLGESGVAKARADRPEGDRPTCTSLAPGSIMMPVAGAEGRGDRPVRRRSRFTLACARAAPLALHCRRRRQAATSQTSLRIFAASAALSCGRKRP